MKRIIKLAFLMLIAIVTVGFAKNVDSTDSILNNEKKLPYKTTYLRFGSKGLPCKKEYLITPSINGGWLFRENKKGVDISINFAGTNKNKKNAFSFNIPQIQYLRFLSDNKNNFYYGSYFGLGGSFCGMYIYEKQTRYYNKKVSNYTGLAASSSIGYIRKLGKKIQPSGELSVNMPTPLVLSHN